MHGYQFIKSLLNRADIQINGTRAWDITVNDQAFFSKVTREGSLGLGESYMQGLWDCEQIDVMITRLLNKGAGQYAESSLHHLGYWLYSLLTNLQSKTRAFMVGEKHYDLGNDLFTLMLDKTMNYSCAYWKEATNLYDAQIAKLDLIAKKLQIEPHMKILDVGCGWGGFAEYAAKHYDCEVTGITISKEQANFAAQRCKDLPVNIILEDYRSLEGKFDRIVSIGMFEHVGYKNYATYFHTLKNLLADDGLFLLHTIGTNDSHIGGDPWINKYIFPNGVLPSISQLIKPTEQLFIMEDWQNLGPDYDQTLMAWHDNFEKAWPTLKSKYNEATYRMFRYYLLICAATFRSRKTQLWQIVFSNYRSQRYDAPR